MRPNLSAAKIMHHDENNVGVDKYDRQLRLWGAIGQRALMQVSLS